MTETEISDDAEAQEANMDTIMQTSSDEEVKSKTKITNIMTFSGICLFMDATKHM